MPRVTIYDGCVIGPRVIIHSGAVIGADGFGMAEEGGRWLKIPQVGRVVVGDDVEIGANTTIDRGAIDDTVIEDGVKLDNQIQIGHNCRIGAHTVIAGCVGISGSVRIGRNCKIGGASMIAGHLSIADGTVLYGGTAVRLVDRHARRLRERDAAAAGRRVAARSAAVAQVARARRAGPHARAKHEGRRCGRIGDGPSGRGGAMSAVGCVED